MKVFEAGEKKILVVKENGNVYAMGAKCTHFGAPLSSGYIYSIFKIITLLITFKQYVTILKITKFV